ncbi:MAG: TonB-dependent siderophore receptor [Cyanobacteria bacterium P01_C01_bin.89]
MKPTLSRLSLLTLLSLGGALWITDAAVGRSPGEPHDVKDYSVENPVENFVENSVEDFDAATAQDPVPGADQLAQASAVTITGLTVEPTDSGVQVVLETAGGALAEPDTSRVVGNALILEIPNALLGRDALEEFQPVEGIALVQVSALPDNRIQLSITGTDAPPTVRISAGPSALTLAVTPGAPSGDGGDDAIQIGVIGEGDNYYVPNATVGTRTDTPLRDVPQSIQVIPREILDDQGVIRLNEAVRNASGVVVNSNDPRGQRFGIRGFGSSSVLRDGVRLANGGVGNIGFQELANIERIEVLKGPASILFGSLQPGGVINLVTEQPLREPRYELSFRTGSRGLLEPSIDITGPLTADGSIRYRLNALYRTEDYFRDFEAPVERYFIAPVIAFDIGDDTNLTLEMEYRNDRRPNDFGVPVIGDAIADIPLDRAVDDPRDETTGESFRVGYRFEHRFNENWKLRNSFFFRHYESRFTFSIADVAVGLGLIPEVFNDTTGDLFLYASRVRQPASNLEMQTNLVGEFKTGSLEHTLLVGIDFLSFRGNDGAESQTFIPPNPSKIGLLNIFNPNYDALPTLDLEDLSVVQMSESFTDSLGIYVQDQVKILDNLILLAGLRFDSVYQESEQFDFLGGATESESEDTAWSPRVGLVYQPSEDISLYASYSTSFTPNFVTTLDGGLLEPERGRQFEIGARAELLEDKLSIGLALFNLEKDNVAVPDPRNPSFSVASDAQRSRGIELDIIGEILPGWNVVANYAYLDTEITDEDDPNSGNRIFNAPEHVANLWTTYEIQSGALEGLMFGGGFNYVSDRFGDLDNSFEVDSYLITNAVIAYEGSNWQAAVNFRNLFDVDYIESVFNSRSRSNYPGEGFTVVGSFSIRL